MAMEEALKLKFGELVTRSYALVTCDTTSAVTQYYSLPESHLIRHKLLMPLIEVCSAVLEEDRKHSLNRR
jgi:TfoX/Sxy family transcriptional regulator of competence genes